MPDISFPDPSSQVFNPAAYGEAAAESKQTNAAVLRRGKAVKKTDKRSFASLFESAAAEVRELPPSEESFHILLEEIHSLGDALSRRPFPEEIKAYRQAVRNFIHYVVENAYDTEKQDGIVRHVKIGNMPERQQKKYTLVKVIDAKLEDLSAAILRGQEEKINILARLEEIQGLLVNLLE